MQEKGGREVQAQRRVLNVITVGRKGTLRLIVGQMAVEKKDRVQKARERRRKRVVMIKEKGRRSQMLRQLPRPRERMRTRMMSLGWL